MSVSDFYMRDLGFRRFLAHRRYLIRKLTAEYGNAQPEAIKEKISRERKKRFIWLLVTAGLLALGFAFMIAWAISSSQHDSYDPATLAEKLFLIFALALFISGGLAYSPAYWSWTKISILRKILRHRIKELDEDAPIE